MKYSMYDTVIFSLIMCQLMISVAAMTAFVQKMSLHYGSADLKLLSY